jgi:hypothetical protein
LVAIDKKIMRWKRQVRRADLIKGQFTQNPLAPHLVTPGAPLREARRDAGNKVPLSAKKI